MWIFLGAALVVSMCFMRKNRFALPASHVGGAHHTQRLHTIASMTGNVEHGMKAATPTRQSHGCFFVRAELQPSHTRNTYYLKYYEIIK